MKIYIKLAFAYLKKQKARTFSMILGVCLAVMLVFGYDVINESHNKKQLDIIYQMYGSYDGIYNNLNKDELEKIKSDKDVKRSGGVAVLGEIISDNGTIIKLNSSDKNYLEMLDYSIKKGRLPSKDSEIVLESQALKHMNINEELNQTIKFKVKKEYEDEFGVNQIFIETRDFKLVGITDKSDYHYKNDWYQFRAFTFFKEGENHVLPENLITYESIVKFKSKSSTSGIRKKLRDLAEKYDTDKDSIRENELLVMAKNEYILSSGDYRVQIYVVATSMILIYNMFNMSLMDMIRQIGLLRAVGVSKKKIRLIIGTQSIFILFIGTLLGLIFGLVYSYFGIKVFGSNVIDIDINVSNKDIYISMKSIIIAITVGTVSVLLSTIIPIWISGRISPMEAFKKTDKTSIFGKRRLIHKITKKLFGVTGEMAYSNIGRNKFRSLISIIAISMGGTLFIQHMSVYNNEEYMGSAPTYLKMQGSSIKLYSDISSDINFVGYTDKDIQEISKIDGVTNIKTKINLYGFLKTEANELDEEYIGSKIDIESTGTIESDMRISGYNSESLSKLEKYIEEGEIIENQTEKYPSAIVCNYYYNRNRKDPKIIKNLKIGDILTIKIPEFKEDKISYKDQKVRVGAFLKEGWIYEGDSTFGYCPEIIIPDKYIIDMSNKNTYNEVFLETDEEKDSKVYSEIKEMFKDKSFVEIYNLKEEKKLDLESPMQRKREYLIIISLILSIAVINIYGTMKTSLLIRINEFSVLKAIGMTSKQLKNMILKETIIYGLLSSIVAATIGTYEYYGFASFVNNQLKEAFNISNSVKFNIPIIEIMQFTTVTMLVCIAVAYLFRKEIDKLSIVEGLKTIK
ncbi:ABC transporter permease protein [Gottschalkia acidurici 9a]|uniref:ABC transporter permease protein n=1 Tax=Gottschalkia acidurici (strain ATCC 7906 / DSM 604 / BCRC 14475 / CIP 104303 / KCTC 5404 / NCIMB 10678 / 9a) TaxID=1128398 RepID=K0B0K8_GOTA9|nr:ABC transporter permease [Gottschalkia acidurici]AFS79573.1 ABC transporter permease protein [Gottschalkia acidurici 9a]